MALVEQIGDDGRWYVQLTAHMALVFASTHLYNIFKILYCGCPFLFKNIFL